MVIGDKKIGSVTGVAVYRNGLSVAVLAVKIGCYQGRTQGGGGTGVLPPMAA